MGSLVEGVFKVSLLTWAIVILSVKTELLKVGVTDGVLVGEDTLGGIENDGLKRLLLST
jgi:hypothetical protein